MLELSLIQNMFTNISTTLTSQYHAAWKNVVCLFWETGEGGVILNPGKFSKK